MARQLQKGATISIDLDLVKMKLKTQCGDAAGIEGVCTYLREDKTSFDKEKFEQDHPDLHDEYTTTGTSMRRVSVKGSRDY
ncbi:MAG TPA: hypothetical protein EYQ11_02065 [Candidatus Poseidoniales archaeon]|nr:hypothetical protein [Candidatus Poseidoniales archaeon]